MKSKKMFLRIMSAIMAMSICFSMNSIVFAAEVSNYSKEESVTETETVFVYTMGKNEYAKTGYFYATGGYKTYSITATGATTANINFNIKRSGGSTWWKGTVQGNNKAITKESSISGEYVIELNKTVDKEILIIITASQ